MLNSCTAVEDFKVIRQVAGPIETISYLCMLIVIRPSFEVVKEDGFYSKGLKQTFNKPSLGKPRTTIIVGLYKTILL